MSLINYTTFSRHSSLVTCHWSLLLGRPHGCQNIRLIAKIFCSHFFDVAQGHGVHIMLESLIVIEAETVKLVERAMITESVVALIGDFLLADQLLFRPL